MCIVDMQILTSLEQMFTYVTGKILQIYLIVSIVVVS